MIGPVVMSSRQSGFYLRGAIVAFVVAIIALSANSSRAGECGGNTAVARTACACGDVITSNTTLLPTDPIVLARCPLTGLIIRAAPTADSVMLNLGGLALVGSGYGYGVRVDHGGTDGARIIGGPDTKRGEIVGFGVGVLAPSERVLTRIERVDVKGSRRDGLHLRATGALVIDVSATDNGGDGIRLRGKGGRLIDIEASGNRGVGLRLQSRGTIVSGRVFSNGDHGVLSEGARNDLSGVEARDNGGVGVIARGGRQTTKGLVSEGNVGGSLRRTAPELEP
jgi:hypothetical protein